MNIITAYRRRGQVREISHVLLVKQQTLTTFKNNGVKFIGNQIQRGNAALSPHILTRLNKIVHSIQFIIQVIRINFLNIFYLIVYMERANADIKSNHFIIRIFRTFYTFKNAQTARPMLRYTTRNFFLSVSHNIAR